MIAGCFLGGLFVLCAAIHDKQITSWEQLGVSVAVIGAAAGVISVTANIYLIKGGIEKKE
ncbi:hypothetical protein [Fimbriiglobus ruber]|uniref:Uncharacterized protein n=1 Tax=Fimbriiglobus ruber TaxID=1908690 RepID=A0A225DTB9_9BACT|nr:hypothetical protein [Fimbriiglobus ruber]OWK44571.1 hypothetical protein FRUB_02503 [Fimbriiglobus ruber]